MIRSMDMVVITTFYRGNEGYKMLQTHRKPNSRRVNHSIGGGGTITVAHGIDHNLCWPPQPDCGVRCPTALLCFFYAAS